MFDLRAKLSTRRLLLIGILAYLVFVCVTFPARVAARWLLPEAVVATHVSGTIWTGRAGAVAVHGLRLSGLTWKNRPLALLTLRLRYRIEADIAGGAVRTLATVTPGGSLALSDVSGVLPVSVLPPPVPARSLSGRVGLALERLRIADNWIADAVGSIDLVDLTVISPVRETLGSYEIVFDGAGEDGVQGTFRDVDAPLDASGTLSLLPERGWRLEGSVRARSAASEQLRQALTLVGPPNADGSHRLSFSSD